MRWIGFGAMACALVGYTFWVYARVELGVRGARGLAMVRAVALVVVAALLFDPSIPTVDASTAGDRWVLLDVSLSMEAGYGEGEGATPWATARDRAQQLSAQGRRVVTFGRGLREGGLPDRLRGDDRTLLAPALERALEAGARDVLVLTDGRFEDVVSVRAALSALPLPIEFELFGEGVLNAGVSNLVVADVPRPDRGATAEVEVHAWGVDSLTVEVRVEGNLVLGTRVPAPGPGLRDRVALELPPPDAEGRVRYTASVHVPGDGFRSDDTAVAYATVGHDEGALVLVSTRPDWEPRYLLPVLGEVTGLPTRGYLRVGPDRYVTMGRAVDRFATADSAAVAAAVADAGLLVVHGLDGDADAWLRAAATRTGRLLAFVPDAGGAGLLGLGVGAPDPGEWYASSEVPPSPLAGQLLGLPPLADVLVLSGEPEGSVPLRLQLRGTGPGQAAIHLGSAATGRRAVVLASGFWRWAAREGEPRAAYRGLWSGVSGWLLRDQGPSGPEVRPSAWVSERGAPVNWRVPGDETTTVRVRVLAGDSVVADTTVAGGDALVTGPHSPGAYDYRAEDASGSGLGSGRFDVQATTAELAFAPHEPDAAAGRAGVDARPARVRPLRTSPWPYLLVLTLLCAEWIGRRRVGLR